MCDGLDTVENVPSPKFQLQLTTGGFEPLSAAVNCTGALQALVTMLEVIIGPTTVTGMVIFASQRPTVAVSVTL